MNLLVRSKFWGRWMISLKQLGPTPRFSICHLSELAEKHQHANDDKGHGSHALDPFERQIITEHASSQNADGGNGREGERCGDEHGPGLFGLRRHGHCSKLSFVAHLREKYHAEGC